MSRPAVPSAARPEGPNSAVTVERQGRCIQQYALNVAPIRWFPSGPVATSLCTVAIASVRWDASSDPKREAANVAASLMVYHATGHT